MKCSSGFFIGIYISSRKRNRYFVIDFVGKPLDTLPEGAVPEADVWASEGKILNIVVQPNPEIKGWRLSFEVDTGQAQTVEMRSYLKNKTDRLSEVWVYRWTA